MKASPPRQAPESSAADVDVDVGVDFDVVVVGAGFGGLSATLTLAERGLRVCCLEALPYSGGCASTFARHGVRYEAGATLFSGLGPRGADGQGGFFTEALARHGLQVDVDWHDPVIEHIADGGDVVAGWRQRERFVSALSADLPAAEAAGVKRFWARQAQVASVMWPILDDDRRMPAPTWRGLRRAAPYHLRRGASYARLAPTLAWLRGKTLADILRHDGIDGVPSVRSWCRSLCQIAVQCDIDDADAVFALCALDYVWRGTGHIRGGVGQLTKALEAAIARAGGRVELSRKARHLQRAKNGFVVDTAKGPLRAQRLVMNLLPADAAKVLREPVPPRWQRRQDAVDEAWGAIMLYAVVQAPPGSSPSPRHVDVVVDDSGALVEGHHAFVSVSSADEGRFDDDETLALGGGDLRAVTVSTHVALGRLGAGSSDDDADVVSAAQGRLRRALEMALPGWALLRTMPASPRTFARYTGRGRGAVGGIPRRLAYGWFDGPFDDGAFVDDVWLVGDTVFPGQSTLGVAVGGARVAHAIADRFGPSRLGAKA